MKSDNRKSIRFGERRFFCGADPEAANMAYPCRRCVLHPPAPGRQPVRILSRPDLLRIRGGSPRFEPPVRLYRSALVRSRPLLCDRGLHRFLHDGQVRHSLHGAQHPRGNPRGGCYRRADRGDLRPLHQDLFRAADARLRDADVFLSHQVLLHYRRRRRDAGAAAPSPRVRSLVPGEDGFPDGLVLLLRLCALRRSPRGACGGSSPRRSDSP